MAQPIQTRTASRRLRALRDGDRASGRGRKADGYPRNREARFQTDRCGLYWLAQDPDEPQDLARNRDGAAANRRTAAGLRRNTTEDWRGIWRLMQSERAKSG